jgi:hypothetical protein
VPEPVGVSVECTLVRETRGCSCIPRARRGNPVGRLHSTVHGTGGDRREKMVDGRDGDVKRRRTSSSGSVRWRSVRCLLNVACGPEVDIECINGV